MRMPLHDRFPVGSEILADINQFVRGNPFISTATLVATISGVTAGIVAVRRRRSTRRLTSKKKRRKRSRVSGRRIKRRKKITHRSPRHKGHKKVSFITKTGKRVSFLVKKPKHTHRKRRR